MIRSLHAKASPAGTAPYAHGTGVDCVLVDGPYGSASQEVFDYEHVRVSQTERERFPQSTFQLSSFRPRDDEQSLRLYTHSSSSVARRVCSCVVSRTCAAAAVSPLWGAGSP